MAGNEVPPIRWPSASARSRFTTEPRFSALRLVTSQLSRSRLNSNPSTCRAGDLGRGETATVHRDAVTDLRVAETNIGATASVTESLPCSIAVIVPVSSTSPVNILCQARATRR